MITFIQTGSQQPGRRRKANGRGQRGAVGLSPGEFFDRLADLVPRPRTHRHRYHGFFATNHPLRPAVKALAIGNPGTRGDAASSAPSPSGRGPGYGSPEPHPAPLPRHLATQEATLMAKIAEDFLLARARGPPNRRAELLLVHDDRDAMQTSPDELPVIDIRSL